MCVRLNKSGVMVNKKGTISPTLSRIASLMLEMFGQCSVSLAIIV